MIVASFLPIYVLSGPSGTLFKPMADTMVFALVGSLIVTLTLLPVLCAWFMRKGVRERRNAAFEAIKALYAKGLDYLPRASLGDHGRLGDPAGRCRCCWSRASAPNSCRSWMKARCGCAPPCPTPFPSTNRPRSRRKIRDDSALLSRKSPPSPRSWAGPMTAPIRPDFSTSNFIVGLKPYSEWTGAYRNKAGADRGHQQEAAGLSRHHLQLHPAGGGCGG